MATIMPSRATSSVPMFEGQEISGYLGEEGRAAYDPNQQAPFAGHWANNPEATMLNEMSMGKATGTTFTPEKMEEMGMHYLGRPILTDADFQEAFAIMQQTLAGHPGGTKDALGMWQVEDDKTLLDKYGKQAVIALATMGTAYGAAGGFSGAAGAGVEGTAGVAGGLEGSAPLAGIGLEAPAATALGTGVASGTAAETAIADLMATGMSAEAAAAAVASGGSTIGPVGAGSSLIPGIPNQVLSGVAQGALGALGAGISADAYKDVSADLLALGDPYRDLLEASYAPDFNLFDQPGYAQSLDQLADITTRQYSASSGNPANNPGISGDIYSSVLNTAYLPALTSYQSGLMNAGNMGLQPASQAMMQIPQANAGLYNAIGYGVGTALAPPNPYDELMKSMTKYYNTIGGTKL